MIDSCELFRIGYLMLNRVGQIQIINPVACKIFGIKKNELLQQDFSNFILTEDKSLWNQLFSGRNEDELKGNRQLRLLRCDGSIFFQIFTIFIKKMNWVCPYFAYSLSKILSKIRKPLPFAQQFSRTIICSHSLP